METVETKTCRRCGETKPLTEFYKDSHNMVHGRKAYCKPCSDAAALDWRERHPSEVQGHHRKYYRNHSDERLASAKARYDSNKVEALVQAWEKRLWREYKLTAAQYDEMLRQQDGRCSICRTTEPGRRLVRFCVDHDHATGKVRGLLCHDCNLLLGHAKDDGAVLVAAVEYLRKSREDHHAVAA